MCIVSLQSELKVNANRAEVADVQIDVKTMAVPPWIIFHCCEMAGSGLERFLLHLILNMR